jgi:hypothetical protein
MTVLIDPPRWPAHGRRWSHLVSDHSFEELHAFAAAQGIPERGFEGDHYDVPEERYAQLVAAGARPVASRDLLRALQDAGLRRPKRRGERVLGSLPEPDGGRLDTMLSALPAAGDVHAVHLLVRYERTVLVTDGAVPARLPWSDLADRTLDRAAAELCESLGLAIDGAVHQLGYLRRVTPLASRSEAQVVLQAAIVESTGRQGVWLDAGRAAEQLWAPLAALVRHLLHAGG